MPVSKFSVKMGGLREVGPSLHFRIHGESLELKISKSGLQYLAKHKLSFHTNFEILGQNKLAKFTSSNVYTGRDSKIYVDKKKTK